MGSSLGHCSYDYSHELVDRVQEMVSGIQNNDILWIDQVEKAEKKRVVETKLLPHLHHQLQDSCD